MKSLEILAQQDEDVRKELNKYNLFYKDNGNDNFVLTGSLEDCEQKKDEHNEEWGGMYEEDYVILQNTIKDASSHEGVLDVWFANDEYVQITDPSFEIESFTNTYGNQVFETREKALVLANELGWNEEDIQEESQTITVDINHVIVDIELDCIYIDAGSNDYIYFIKKI